MSCDRLVHGVVRVQGSGVVPEVGSFFDASHCAALPAKEMERYDKDDTSLDVLLRLR